MKKRTKWILALLTLLFIGGIAFAATRGGSSVAVVTEVVKRGDLLQTVEVTGDTQSIKDIDLAFNTSGSVAAINVIKGEKVRAGDVLAVLSDAKLSAAVAQAADTVAQAQAALDVKLAGSTDEEIAVYQAAVDAAVSSLASAKTEEVQTQTSGDVAVAAAEDDVVQITDSTADALAQSQEDVLESVRSLVAEVRSALGKADTILGVENTLANDAFDRDLATQDSTALSDAIDAFKTAAKSRDAAEDALRAANAADSTLLDAAVDAARTSYEDAYQTLLETSRVLDATSADSTTLSLDDLATFKTSIAGATSSLTADGSALVSAEQTRQDAQRAATDDVVDAQHALAKAKALRDQNNASAAAQVASASASLASREAELAQIKADPRSVDLAGLEAAVAIAQAQYEGALANAADAQMISPIDGQVTAINIDVGEQASAGATMMTVLSTSDQFEIVMDIPEADIAKIRAGQTSEVTFDAFGDDRVFAGSVLSVDPAEKLIEGVVFYEAKVVLNSAEDVTGIKPGMSANVTIKTGEAKNILFVPKRALLEENGVKYVRIPKDSDGNFDRRTVTVGLYADDGSAEITSGLSEGETVIVTIR